MKRRTFLGLLGIGVGTVILNPLIPSSVPVNNIGRGLKSPVIFTDHLPYLTDLDITYMYPNYINPLNVTKDEFLNKVIESSAISNKDLLYYTRSNKENS